MSEAITPEVRKEALELVHHHPGRLRVRAAPLRADGTDARDHAELLATRVREGLEAVPGVQRVAHNARTGSLLVEYEPGLAEPDAIVTRIAQLAGLLSPFDPAARRPPRTAATATIDAARDANAVVFELSGWRADLRSLVPGALAGLAAFSFVFDKNGPRWPRWDNLLWWSYSAFTQLHQREIQRGDELEKVVEKLEKKDGGAA